MFDLTTHVRAQSADQAVALLKEHPGSRLIAGGTDVLIKLREGKKGFDCLVDIHGLPELDYIRIDDDGSLAIGSGTTFSRIMDDPVIQQHLPMLCEGAGSVGGPQIRNVATIGGNICNGVPSADSAPSLFTANALVVILGEDGIRDVSIQNFFKGPGKVDLGPCDLVTGFRIPPENFRGFSGHYYKYAMRNAMDIATIGCGVNLKVTDDKIADFRICFGVAGPTPMRCPTAEQTAMGRQPDQALLEDIAAAVMADVQPRDSWRATKAFRRNIISELSRRATRKALARGGCTL